MKGEQACQRRTGLPKENRLSCLFQEITSQAGKPVLPSIETSIERNEPKEKRSAHLF